MSVLAGLLRCLFGVLGILTSGLIFVPLAVLCALGGLARGIVGGNAAGIGTSLLAGILSAIGFAVSPSLWLLTAGLIGASQSDQSNKPEAQAPDESGPSPPRTRPPQTNDTRPKCTLLSGELCPGATNTSPPRTEKAKSRDCLTDGRILTMRGIVVEKVFTDYDQGKPFKHRYIALEFYRPRCTITEYAESEPAAMFEQLDETSQYWIGRHVIAKVKVSETGGTIHYPTSVVLTPIEIREESH
jgi:hypothetical protein